MSDERARELVRLATQLKTERSTFESHWQDIADVMRPQAQPFTTEAQNKQQGDKRTAKMFDAVPALSLEKFAAVLEALLSPRNQIWSKLAVTDEALQQDIEVQRYLDQVNKILFRVRYRPASNLASQLAESYLNLGSFGTQALFVGDDPGRSIVYRSCGLHKLLIAEDQHGRVNQVFRNYEFTADQACGAFAGDKSHGSRAERDRLFALLPQSIKSAYESKSRTLFKFLHCVVPRDVVESDRRDYRGMAWASLHVFTGDQTVIDEGGYRVLPYCVSRYTKNTEELYGRSPAMLVLPDTNMLNRMNKAVIKGAEKAVDPPLMLMDDSLAPFNLTAGALNYGTLDVNGNPTVKAFEHKGDVRLGLEMMEQKRQIIKEAFLLDVFQVLLENPNMTATQVLEVAKDKAALLSPVMGRQQSELFGPMTERELDILSHANQLPPMPEALIEAGGEVTVEYLSPMSIAQRAESGVAILRTLESVLPLTQTDEGKTALRVFDIAKTVRELAEINNFPAKALRSEEEIKQLAEQDQQSAQMSQLLQAAPVVSQSLKSMAEAQAALPPGSVNV